MKPERIIHIKKEYIAMQKVRFKIENSSIGIGFKEIKNPVVVIVLFDDEALTISLIHQN